MDGRTRIGARITRRTLYLLTVVVACSGGEGSMEEGATEASTSTGSPLTVTTQADTQALDDTVEPSSTGSATDDTTGSPGSCGNDLLEPGEQCDGEALGGSTCLNLFGYGGTLACAEQCTYDLGQCYPPGMIAIPGGELWMGSNAHGLDELPAREVYVSDFFIDATEVTVAQYAGCVSDGDCGLPTPGPACNWGVSGRDDHPINCVTWQDAHDYCSWAGGVQPKRLPTEAEWEKAARGTDERTYPWGNEPPPDCSLIIMNLGGGGGCGMLSTHPVGSRPLGDSPYGVHDMAGSAWNWVADWYGPYDVAETDDPTGPPTGTLRVLRGGGWDTTDIHWFRTSARNPHVPEATDRNIGFRCAVSPPTLP